MVAKFKNAETCGQINGGLPRVRHFALWSHLLAVSGLFGNFLLRLFFGNFGIESSTKQCMLCGVGGFKSF